MPPAIAVLRALAIASVFSIACERSESAAPEDATTKSTGKQERGSALPDVVAQQVTQCLAMPIDGETGESGSREPAGACQNLVPLSAEVEAHLQKRCDEDEAAACHMLGDMLRGERVVKYIGELVHTACGKKTCSVLRRQFAVSEVGEARADAVEKSSALLERGCELGRGEACLTRAVVEKDITVAVQWMRKACAQGLAAGCAHDIHHSIMFGGASVDPAAVTKLGELCDKGKASACASFGVMVARKNKDAKIAGKPAIDLWTSACTAGSSGGCASVVFHAMQNKIEDTVRDTAASSLAKTCPDGKVGPDCTAAAFALFKGWSTPANKPAARTWLAKNCDAGIEAACDVPRK